MTADVRRERAQRALRLVIVTDRTVCRDGLVAAVTRAIEGGVTAVMMREKDLGHEELVRLGRSVRDVCSRLGASFLVNHDAQAAAELAADGVHLGFRSASVAAARAMVGDAALVGCSTHDITELDRALQDGADYVTFGPVYDTPSKRDLLAPRGTSALRDAVVRAGTVPVVALGGVTSHRAAELRAAGAAGLACIREILACGDETQAARRLASAWESGR